MNSKNILWAVATFFAIIVGLWGVWSLMTQPKSTDSQKKVDVAVSETDHVKGPDNAPVTIVEYSDLQCPACRAYAPLVKSILEKNPETVKLVYRHFPLEMHKHALAASYAAEAAGKQGKFFEYHDILFDRQGEWETSKNVSNDFLKYAKELKLNEAQFKKDSSSKEVKDFVEDQRQSGIGLQVNATPTFFINGLKVQNPNSLEEFQKLIDAALENSEATPSPQTGDVEATQAAEPTKTQ